MSTTADSPERHALAPGERLALRSGTETRTGTITDVPSSGCVRLADDATGRIVLVDLSHWDTVLLDTSWPAPRLDAEGQWLRDAIAADPDILGLGALRAAHRSHSMDALILDDPATGTRYAVDIQPGMADAAQLERAAAAAAAEQGRSPHTVVVPVVVAEQIPEALRPTVGLAVQMAAADTGHGLRLEPTVLAEETGAAGRLFDACTGAA
ncbi:hypothetical protein [Sinomonas sp. R1AF57]|uniref:hypothetical protein n=1 Tax=Sinomonas sp. R1AF57 TaxID=2020377 RepID=UPI000B5E51DE|nr:hypothetical protein [Sinomonas sp. R1AF57]ASN53618.1 hypothetical protein CGQ25_17300 [Sinomonas sp. R1AF57]